MSEQQEPLLKDHRTVSVDDVEVNVADNTLSLTADQIIKNGIIATGQDENKKPYDEAEFNRLYTDLIEQNDGLYTKPTGMFSKFSSKVPIIIKPTELAQKMVLFDLLVNIEAVTKSDDPNITDEYKKNLAKKLSEAFFKDLINLTSPGKTIPNNPEAIESNIKNGLIGDFIKKLTISDSNGNILTRFFTHMAMFTPIISTFRDIYNGKYRINFNSKAKAEESIQQQIKEAKTGIENQFSLLSAVIGTKSQKVAARTVAIAGAATGLWALVAKLQQNPETSAILIGVATAAGPQALLAGAIFAAVVVGYYAFLKIQDKYAKYDIMIRTMNEFIIVLNKIDRLVHLAYFISDKYHFDVNLKEIESQLKVIFARFDKMLNDDDRNVIEKNLENNITPDLNGQANNASDQNDSLKEATTQGVVGGNPQKGGAFVSIMGFDEERWNKLLNDDVVKLNLFFTASITEFGMILNVLQMTMLADETKKPILVGYTNEIQKSTEYQKMVIGILLNDILKLRVDFLYCTRGGGGFFSNWISKKMTNTKDELVCLENTGSDPVGNKRSLFRENLHTLMIHLVKILNNENNPYPKEISAEIFREVVEPYKAMITKVNTMLATAQTNDKNRKEFQERFFLTKANTLQDIQVNTEPIFSSLNQKGGAWYNTDVSPTPERDNQIIAYLNAQPYEMVTDSDFVEFLARVNKFVKGASKPTPAEQQKAMEVAKQVADDVAKIHVQTSAPSTVPATGTGTGATPAAEAKAAAAPAPAPAPAAATGPGPGPAPADTVTGNGPATATLGGSKNNGRRFTRRHNNRKRYRNTRGKKQSRRTM
jgi:hypothetical protein